MNALPTVSVCIANYNGLEVIDACIASVLAQDCGFPVEIIVHDDASTDGSAQYIREKYPEVRLLESDKNVGFCIANNRMVQTARGEYLLLLNNDAELFRDALRVLQMEAQHRDPAILTLPQYDADSGELVDMGCLFDPFLNPVLNLNPTRGEVGMVIGACFWISRLLWKELGGFPEWFGSIAEDMYLCCRAHLAGHPVRALSVSGYRHWQGKSFGGGKVTGGRLSTTYRRRALSETNKSFVMILTYPAPLFQLIFPIHLALLLLEGLVLALIKREWEMFRRIYLACLLGIWRKRATLSHLRREIQKSRKISPRGFMRFFLLQPRKLGLLLRHGVPRID